MRTPDGQQRWLAGAVAAAAAPAFIAMAGLWWTAPAVSSFTSVKEGFTPSAAYLVDRHGEVLDSMRIDMGVRRLQWTPIEAISPALIAAVVAGEDQRFFEHDGVDWRAAIAALDSQLIHRRRRGASTITMQLASLLNERRRGGGVARNWSRKIAQIRTAHAIEARWSKQQILEAYLNLVEYRGELQGIAAAAQVLAEKTPSGLSSAESQVLAALLPDPAADARRVGARACARVRGQAPAASCDAVNAAAAAMLGRADPPQPTESLAPQLSAALLKSPGERVQTTLDAGIQRLALEVLRSHLGDLANRNVRDGAVLVVDNSSGDVLAYVGSGGPLSRARHVDGVRARRQAGSTLKPFLYELALERRYMTAASLLDDSALNLDTGTGVYIPQDYDHEFKGLVSLRTALGSSLNVPAVRTLVIVGVQPFRDRLHELGYEGITQDGEYYGFSLALGSAEVSLWEQAQAYRTLARGGRFSPLKLRRDDPASPDRAVIPEAPSFIVGDILSDHMARAATFGLDNHLNTPFWSAAKTGTSKDMRDNWCIGFSRRFTVAVWVGNFEGDAMHDVSGVTGAAPVWHDVMATLHQDLASLPPLPPAGVAAAATRFSPAVEPSRREWYLPGTQAQIVQAVTTSARVARIVSPANGMIIALDPDIPLRNQRIPVTAQGVKAGMLITLNDKVLGPATQDVFLTPSAGAHHLALRDAGGRTVDRILFTVR
jgi:penicillin-binding protein 1C